jgi:hypothetical protein
MDCAAPLVRDKKIVAWKN